jgi:hypothetical protein
MGSVLEKDRTVFEQLCPRWRDCVNDKEVLDDSARLTLVKNKSISKIPEAIKLVDTRRQELEAVCSVFGTSELKADKLTKDMVFLTDNSLQFGRSTFSVAAAAKVLLTEPDNLANVKMCLEKLKSLPVALVARLEELRDSKQSKQQSSASAASAPKMPSKAKAVKLEPSVKDAVAAAAAAPEGPKAKKARN